MGIFAGRLALWTEKAMDGDMTWEEIAQFTCAAVRASAVLGAAIRITGSQLHDTMLRDLIECAVNACADVLE